MVKTTALSAIALTDPKGSRTTGSAGPVRLSESCGNSFSFGNVDRPGDSGSASYTDHARTRHFRPVVFARERGGFAVPANHYPIAAWGKNRENHQEPDAIPSNLVATGTPTPDRSTVLFFCPAGAGVRRDRRGRSQTP